MTLPKLLRDIMTEDAAGTVYCPVRVIGASGALTLIGNAIYMAVAHRSFDAAGFGEGLAAICGAVGLGAGVKAKLGG